MKRATTPVQMALVLALACVLGAVFNNASPLGLRFNESTLPPAALRGSTAVTQAIPMTATELVPLVPVVPAKVTPPPVVTAVTNPPPPPAPPTPVPIGNTTWPQAKEQLADGRTILVDARVAPYYQAGHIPNAVSLPAQSGAEEFAAFKAKYPPTTTPLIIYCGAEQCHLSQALATILTTQHGYTNVKVMTGGFTEYIRAEAEAKAAAEKK